MADNPVYRTDDRGHCWNCRRETPLLAGAGHTPYNAEANYVCRQCLDPDATIYDMRRRKLVGLTRWLNRVANTEARRGGRRG